ncbi:PqqD family protein [Sphingomonas bacterium]|uniref:PqqD family protein n=1 Tax=Sphingomonas bacterium TaxID=1895847 RepID=UPI00260756DB|nr:PqqD family protein [Sphingomonas bacterium]
METAIDGDMVALDIENGACFGFNATATRIWALLDTPMPIAAVVDHLVGEFAVDRARCRDEVTALLRQLEGRGLVRLEPAI